MGREAREAEVQSSSNRERMEQAYSNSGRIGESINVQWRILRMMFNLIDRSNDPEHISKIHDIYFTMIQSNVGEKERRIRRESR